MAEVYQTERDESDALVSQELLFGHYVSYDVEAPTPLTAADITVTKHSDSEDGSWPEPDETIYAYSAPKLTLEAKITGSDYTWSQVEWYTDNEQVARITDASKNNATAELALLGTGTANFYIRAVNGNLSAYRDGTEDAPYEDDGTYSKKVATLTVGEGEVPYLTIPEDQLTVRAGEDVTVRWASNLVQKNAEYNNTAPTTFTINVYQGEDTSGTPVQTHTVTYDPKDTTNETLWVDGTPNQSYVLSGLTETAAAGAVSYTVTVSAQAAAGVPGVEAEDRTVSDSAAVSVVAQPVSVKLDRPDSFYVTNSGTLELGYTLTSFDLNHNAAFELTVTDNANGKVVYHSDTADSADGGRFSLDLSKAEIPDGFRTIYDVSVKAKNTAEPDWSRDSFTLYIYDRDALQIQVQEVVRDGQATVTFDGNTVHMSNEAWIASLNQDQILALNRDIDLQAELGINYDDHPWGEASDRVEWSSQDSSTAAVNYPQGAYYEDIEDLPYTSFAPATEFLLSGKNDGTTVVEAIHALAGDALSDQVTVQVETLKDKLYLFQFYPAAADTEFSYINGDGVEKHCKTDDQGRGAVMRPAASPPTCTWRPWWAARSTWAPSTTRIW